MDRLRSFTGIMISVLFALFAPLFAFASDLPASVPAAQDSVRLVTLDERTPGPWFARARESAEFRTTTSWEAYMAKSCAMTSALAASGHAAVLSGWNCADPIANWPNPPKGSVIAVPVEPTLVFVPGTADQSAGLRMPASEMRPSALADSSDTVPSLHESAPAALASTNASESSGLLGKLSAFAVVAVIVAIFLVKLVGNRKELAADEDTHEQDWKKASAVMEARHGALRDRMQEIAATLGDNPSEGRSLSDIKADALRIAALALKEDLYPQDADDPGSEGKGIRPPMPWPRPNEGSEGAAAST